jgi:hypothetical protein
VKFTGIEIADLARVVLDGGGASVEALLRPSRTR